MANPYKTTLASMSEMPANTPLSDKISKDLKGRGFKFVGSTIVYRPHASYGHG